MIGWEDAKGMGLEIEYLAPDSKAVCSASQKSPLFNSFCFKQLRWFCGGLRVYVELGGFEQLQKRLHSFRCHFVLVALSDK